MYFVQMMINFIISSGSGHALVTMPIMAPLADIVGVTRQTAVLAYQLGDGFTHIFYPTSGYFMAALAIAGVSYQMDSFLMATLLNMDWYFSYCDVCRSCDWLVLT